MTDVVYDNITVNKKSVLLGNVDIGTTEIPQSKPPAKLVIFGAPPETDNIGTTEIMRLVRDVKQNIKTANSASLNVGSFEKGTGGRTRLDFNLSGSPTDDNCQGSFADVNVMSLLANGNVGVGTTTPEDTLQVGVGVAKLVTGAAVGESLWWGTSYIGFNAGRTRTNNTWKFDTDTSHNGGAVIHSSIDGDLFFSTVRTNKPENAQILTDSEIVNGMRLVINSAGLEVKGDIKSNGNIKANGSELQNLSVKGNVGIGITSPDDKFHVGEGPCKLVIGASYGESLGWGTSYIGFNAGRTNTGWKFDTDTSNNGGAVIYATIGGSLVFSTVPTKNAANGNQTLSDGEVLNNQKLVINPDGNIIVAGDILLKNADCAEDFDIIDAESIEPGTVMVIDDDGALRASEQAYDKRVAGVISGAGDLRPGIMLDKQSDRANRLPVALTGKVYCKVDANYGAVEVGDLLTTSSTKGHAMKVIDHYKSLGTIIGKALRPMKKGQGMIPILVALQ